MNTDHSHHQNPVPDGHAEAAAAEVPDARTNAGERVVPEAVQAADIHRTDDAEALAEGGMAARARGVDWVRPSDLLARGTGRVARSAIDFQAHLAEQARSGLRAGASRLGERARRLPPVTAFGPGPAGRSRAERDAVGMS